MATFDTLSILSDLVSLKGLAGPDEPAKINPASSMQEVSSLDLNFLKKLLTLNECSGMIVTGYGQRRSGVSEMAGHDANYLAISGIDPSAEPEMMRANSAGKFCGRLRRRRDDVRDGNLAGTDRAGAGRGRSLMPL